MATGQTFRGARAPCAGRPKDNDRRPSGSFCASCLSYRTCNFHGSSLRCVLRRYAPIPPTTFKNEKLGNPSGCFGGPGLGLWAAPCPCCRPALRFSRIPACATPRLAWISHLVSKERRNPPPLARSVVQGLAPQPCEASHDRASLLVAEHSKRATGSVHNKQSAQGARRLRSSADVTRPSRSQPGVDRFCEHADFRMLAAMVIYIDFSHTPLLGSCAQRSCPAGGSAAPHQLCPALGPAAGPTVGSNPRAVLVTACCDDTAKYGPPTPGPCIRCSTSPGWRSSLGTDADQIPEQL